MECEVCDKLLSKYITALDRWKSSVSRLPDPPVPRGWAAHQREIDECKVVHERVSQARSVLEAHQTQHGC
jgi:hypothetical protein